MQTTGREDLERRSDRPSRDIEQTTKHTQLNAACLSETAKRKLSPCVRIKHACVREKKELLYGLKLDKTYHPIQEGGGGGGGSRNTSCYGNRRCRPDGSSGS